MSDLVLLSEAQMRRIEPYFPLSHGIPRVDDHRAMSGAEPACGPDRLASGRKADWLPLEKGGKCIVEFGR